MRKGNAHLQGLLVRSKADRTGIIQFLSVPVDVDGVAIAAKVVYAVYAMWWMQLRTICRVHVQLG